MGPLRIKFSEIRIKIQDLSFMKMHLKMSSVKRQPFCPGEDKFMQLSSTAVTREILGNIDPKHM